MSWGLKHHLGGLAVFAGIVLALIGCSAPAPAAPAQPPQATSAPAPPASQPTVAPAAPAQAPARTSGPCDPKQVRLVTSIRTLSNPYQADWANGAQLFASSVGLPLQILVDEADSQKQLSLLRALVATGGGNCIAVNLDPNTNSDTVPEVKALTDAGAWVVTQWSLPDDVYPWKISDHWITSIAPDGRVGGYEIAANLFKAMGGKGNIVALEGILDGLPQKQRFAGLQKALGENPGIKLLDAQTAEWDRQKAFNITQTWLTKYPGQINGVWAANDNMALGALEAIRAAGQYGKIPVVGIDAVPEALQDIAKGDGAYVATSASDGYWQGGIGLALGYMASTGKLDVASMKQEQRLSYIKQTIITKENVAKFLNPPSLADLKPDWDNPFARFTGPVTFPAY